MAAQANPERDPTVDHGRLHLRHVAARTLDAAQRDAIWQFYSRFVVRDREAFLAKVMQTDEVIFGEDAQGQLRGFGAVQVLTVNWQGRPHGLLHTGWSAVDPAWRGCNFVQRAGLRAYLRYRLAHPTHPVYWFFWASTYKSYLLMTRNFRDCWPRPGQPWPAREAALVAQAMAVLGDSDWDRAAGVVRRHGASRYLDGSYATDPAALADPDVRFYAALNPRQHEGDTVVCLASLSLSNWALIAVRSLGRVLRRGAALALARWRDSRGAQPAWRLKMRQK